MYGKECIRSFLVKKRLLGILLLFVVHCPVVGQMVFLPLNLELNTNYEISLLQKISAFDKAKSLAIWSANLNRSFAANRLSLCIRFNNILRQNSGIYRFVHANQITETQYNVAGQYLTMSVMYQFKNKNSD